MACPSKETSMRRLLAITLWSLLLGGLLLAGPPPAAAQEETLAKIKRTGAMIIGFRESSPPFSYVAANDPKPQGYSIDLCLRIVESVKKDLALPQLDVKWVKLTPENRASSVANGTVDIECGSTTKTLGRMAQVDFTVLTYLDGGSLLTASAANINKLTDLSGKRVAVIPGTTTERAVRDMIKKLGLQSVTLLAGLAVSSRNPAKLYLIEDFISYEPYALMVRRGDPNFHLAVDRALIRLYRSAEVVPIYEKWFGPFPEGGSLIAAVYVLNSVPD